MNTRLADLRSTMTQAEADTLLEEYARLSAQKAALEARLERRIVELKSREQPKLDSLQLSMDALAEPLGKYIAANPDKFTRPRTRKTSFGEYGLRTVTTLDVPQENMPALLDDLTNQDELSGCIKHTQSLVKSACIKNIRTSPDAARFFLRHRVVISTGDVVVLKVSKALIDEARKQANNTP